MQLFESLVPGHLDARLLQQVLIGLVGPISNKQLRIRTVEVDQRLPFQVHVPIDRVEEADVLLIRDLEFVDQVFGQEDWVDGRLIRATRSRIPSEIHPLGSGQGRVLPPGVLKNTSFSWARWAHAAASRDDEEQCDKPHALRLRLIPTFIHAFLPVVPSFGSIRIALIHHS